MGGVKWGKNRRRERRAGDPPHRPTKPESAIACVPGVLPDQRRGVHRLHAPRVPRLVAAL